MQVESLYLRQSRPTVELSHSSIDLTLEPTQDERYIYIQPYQNVNQINLDLVSTTLFSVAFLSVYYSSLSL